MNKKVIECGEGWKEIYENVINKIITHDNACKNVEDKIGIAQVKEKWGALDIYPLNRANLTKEIAEAITNAYIESKKVCEYCGDKENVGATMNHWSKTCCKNCWIKYIVPNHTDSRWKDFNTNLIHKQEE